MGDRGNIELRYEGGEKIFLYSHWSGSDLVERLRAAISKRWRWDDPQYLGRIIFDAVLNGDHGGETGFGLSPWIGDGDVKATVHMDEQEIEVAGVRYPFDTFVQGERT